MSTCPERTPPRDRDAHRQPSSSHTTSPTATQRRRRSRTSTMSATFNAHARPTSGPFRPLLSPHKQRSIDGSSVRGTGQIVSILSLEARRGILTANVDDAVLPCVRRSIRWAVGAARIPAPRRPGDIGRLAEQRSGFGSASQVSRAGTGPKDARGGSPVTPYVTRRPSNVFLGVRLTDPDPQWRREEGTGAVAGVSLCATRR